MRIPKRYGQSKIEECPFCGRTSVTKNSQGVAVCQKHKNTKLENLKCACGDYLDIKSGKWGAYFSCMNCGNINLNKGLELNPQIREIGKAEAKKASENKVKENNEKQTNTIKQKQTNTIKQQPKETTITSDDVDFL